MHKKGVTEEVAKKRSRKSVKHQRGIVGADLASILAKRTQKPEVRNAARQAAITKAKGEKKEKASRPKVRSRWVSSACRRTLFLTRVPVSSPLPSLPLFQVAGATAPKVSKQQAKGAKPAARV